MLAALSAALAVACAAAAIAPNRLRLSENNFARVSTLNSRELARIDQQRKPFWQQLVAPLLAALAVRVQGRWAGMTTDDLRRAGIDPARVTIEDVVAMKVLGAIAGASSMVAVSLVLPGAILLMPALAFAGFIAPTIVIRKRKAARRAQLLRELPDLVGLLKAFVTAGMTLEQALHLISEQQSRVGSNLLAREIRHALSDYGLGLGLDEALATMAERTGLDELDMLASALAQGKRQGAGMERILRDQESVVRLAQRNRTTAEASRVGTRLVGVLVAVYLPEFMVLIMVPLFYGIFLRAFS